MLEKTVTISGREVKFRSSATVPRLYRIKFKRDIFKDMAKLERSYKGKTKEGEELQIKDLEIFENVAYIMAYHADHSIPGTIDEWLDQFETFSIILHVIIPFLIENYAPYLFKRESKSYIISNQKSSTFSLAATRVLTNSSVDIAVLLDSSVRRPSSVRIRVSSTALIDTAMLTQEAMHFFESGEYLL